MSALQWLEPDEFPVWRRRLELERRAGHLTPARRDALRALLAFHGEDGLYPSDAAVAELAGTSARTVRRARVDAKNLGMLSWRPTRKLVNGSWRQGPNRYTIQVPTELVCPGGQNGQQRKQEKKEKGLTREERPQPAQPRACIDLLAARQTEIRRRLDAGWRPGQPWTGAHQL